MWVFAMQGRPARKDVGVDRSTARRLELLLYRVARHLEGVLVGDHDGRLVPEVSAEHLVD
jgi:hypothetical protein